MRMRWCLFGVVLVHVGCGHAAPPPTGGASPAVAADAGVTSTVEPDSAPAGPPVARTGEVSETIFGVTVTDPYRWMEDEAEERDRWMREQGEYAAQYLDGLAERDTILASLREVGERSTSVDGVRMAGGRAFFRRIAAGAQLSTLVVREADGSERVLVDPATIEGSGGARGPEQLRAVARRRAAGVRRVDGRRGGLRAPRSRRRDRRGPPRRHRAHLGRVHRRLAARRQRLLLHPHGAGPGGRRIRSSG